MGIVRTSGNKKKMIIDYLLKSEMVKNLLTILYMMTWMKKRFY